MSDEQKVVLKSEQEVRLLDFDELIKEAAKLPQLHRLELVHRWEKSAARALEDSALCREKMKFTAADNLAKMAEYLNASAKKLQELCDGKSATTA